MLYNTKTTVSRLQSDSPPFVLHVHSSTHTNACEGDTNTTRAPRVVVVVAVLNRRWCEGAFLETMCRDNRFGNGCYGVQRHHLVAGEADPSETHSLMVTVATSRRRSRVFTMDLLELGPDVLQCILQVGMASKLWPAPLYPSTVVPLALCPSRS